jgi:hypothetical protein
VRASLACRRTNSGTPPSYRTAHGPDHVPEHKVRPFGPSPNTYGGAAVVRACTPRAWARAAMVPTLVQSHHASPHRHTPAASSCRRFGAKLCSRMICHSLTLAAHTNNMAVKWPLPIPLLGQSRTRTRQPRPLLPRHHSQATALHTPTVLLGTRCHRDLTMTVISHMLEPQLRPHGRRLRPLAVDRRTLWTPSPLNPR